MSEFEPRSPRVPEKPASSESAIQVADFLWREINLCLDCQKCGSILTEEAVGGERRNVKLTKEGKRTSRGLFADALKRSGNVETLTESLKLVREQRDELRKTDTERAKEVSAFTRSLFASNHYETLKEFVRKSHQEPSGGVVAVARQAEEIKNRKEHGRKIVDKVLPIVSSLMILWGLSSWVSSEGYIDSWKIKQAVKSFVPGIIHQLREAFGDAKKVEARGIEQAQKQATPTQVSPPETKILFQSPPPAVVPEPTNVTVEFTQITESTPQPTFSPTETVASPELPRAGVIFQAEKEEKPGISEVLPTISQPERIVEGNRIIMTGVTNAYDGNNDNVLDAEIKEISPSELDRNEKGNLIFPNPKKHPELRDKIVVFHFLQGWMGVIENTGHLADRPAFANWTRASLEEIVANFQRGVASPCSITFKGEPYVLIEAIKVENTATPDEIFERYPEYTGNLLVLVGCSDPQNGDPYNSKLARNVLIAVKGKVIGQINGVNVVVPYWAAR